jgi:ketosteroid isomerase-like protein
MRLFGVRRLKYFPWLSSVDSSRLVNHHRGFVVINCEELKVMRYAATIAALVLTIGVGACATGANEQAFTRADQDAIRKNSADLTAAFNEKQVDRILTLYADSSVFMPPNAPLLRGRDPLRSFYGDMIKRGATDFRLEPEEISGHGPIAYESGTYSVTYAGGGSRDRGKYLRVLRNMAGTWRAEKMIWSSDLPPPPSPAD